MFKTEYCQATSDFLSQVYDPTLVDDTAKVIESGMTNDPTDTQQAWQADVTSIRDFTVAHEATAQYQVSSACN